MDTGSWRRIYNLADACGGDVITGGAARLHPYLKGDGDVDRPKPGAELPIDEPCQLTSDQMGYTGRRFATTRSRPYSPKGSSNVNDRAVGDARTVALHAGLVAVTQDDDGTLRPVPGDI